MHTQIREKAPGIHTVPTTENEFPGTKHIESMRGSSMIQWEKMQRKIWDGEIHLCQTQEFMLVEEVWDSEMGKECLIKV